MATTVTPLSLITELSAERPSWALNVVSDDVSSGEIIKVPIPNKRHVIEKITVTYKSGGTNWWKLLDGMATLIGPVIVADGQVWQYTFLHPIYGTLNTNLKIKTQASGNIHVLIEGFTES